MKYAFLMTAALMLSPFAAGAQTANTTATATIENYALNIVKTQDLNFGSVIPSASLNGTMELSAHGVVNTSGGVTSRPSSGHTTATYSINGVPAASFSVAIAPGVITLSSPRGTLTVGDFTFNKATPITLDGTGSASFAIGATLFVNAGQLPGNYTGTFDVTIAYN